MLTLRTKLALAVLHDIQYKDYQLSTSLNPSPSEIAYLLQKLSKGRLIALIENRPDNQSDNRPESYRLACAYHQINLLSILEALGLHLAHILQKTLRRRLHPALWRRDGQAARAARIRTEHDRAHEIGRAHV